MDTIHESGPQRFEKRTIAAGLIGSVIGQECGFFARVLSNRNKQPRLRHKFD